MRADAVSFDFVGVPGRGYQVQRAEQITGPWLIVGTFVVQPDGFSKYLDPTPLPHGGFYRCYELP